MASTPFGEHLKRERELRGVTLDEVAAATRIKASFLEALENGRWNQLPGGAFNRGFIRSTSRFLGLDEDGMVAEYALETGASFSKPAVEPSGAMPRDYRPAAVLLSVFLLGIVLAAWFGHHIYVLHKRRQAASPELNPVSAPSIAPASRAYSSAAIATPSVVNAAAPPAAAPPEPPSGAAADANAAARAEAASPLRLQLSIEATKRTEVKVVADRRTLFEGHLGAGAFKAFEASDRFELTASDASGVQIVLNGRNIPFPAPHGHRGSTVSLSRQDLKPPEEIFR